jgi:hypothetical protein
MPLPRRQRRFLGLIAAVGVTLAVSGLWELWLAGAVHELVCGAVILMLVLAAWPTWSRSPD